MATAEDLHPHLKEIADHLEAATTAVEQYTEFVQDGITEMEDDETINPQSVQVWAMQLKRVESFLAHLDDDVWERVRQMIDRTAVMELAKRGEFV